MGLIDRLLKGGKCESCGHLVQISDTALGCQAHDKLVMPQHMPYSSTNHASCRDWVKREEA